MEKDLTLERTLTLYSSLNEICQDYSRMTDGYSLATGDKQFEQIPDEIRKMIHERQLFFSYRGKVKEVLKKKILEEMKDYE
jgi:hypothetical protein